MIFGVVLFGIYTAAAFAHSRRICIAALLIVLGYTLLHMVRAEIIRFAGGAWQPALSG